MNFFGRIANRYETCSRPGIVLAVLVVSLYGWTVPSGFFIDDFRHLQFMRAYRDGARAELSLYRFLRGDEANAALRRDGYYPWWVGDDVRYQHSRPWAERWLYGQYVVFGDRAWAYHAVSLAMYAAGILLVLRLYRLVLADERLARWAGLIFAVAGAHAVGVVFASMQCDLLGLLLVGAAMCMAVGFVRDGGVWRLAVGLVFYGLALGAKESSLPTAVLPLMAGWAWRKTPPRDREMAPGALLFRRGVLATGLLLIVGVCWLGWYARGGYGANNALMLDPMRAPGHYFSELWVRAGVLLATWLVPVNPFLFYLRPFGRPLIPVFSILGIATILIFTWLARRRGAGVWVIWTLAFLPLLVCTPPDDRNMLLPGIGFAALAAVWMWTPRREADLVGARAQGTAGGGVRWIPVCLFILAQVPTAVATALIVGATQATVERNITRGLEAFGRPTKPGDQIVFVNLDNDAQVLFGQYAMDWYAERAPGGAKVRISFLTDIRNPNVTIVDEHTIRLEGVEEPILGGFLGAMGRPRGRHWGEGDEVDAGAYRVRIVRMKDGDVREIEARFKDPLASDSVRVLRCVVGGKPERISVSK